MRPSSGHGALLRKVAAAFSPVSTAQRFDLGFRFLPSSLARPSETGAPRERHKALARPIPLEDIVEGATIHTVLPRRQLLLNRYLLLYLFAFVGKRLLPLGIAIPRGGNNEESRINLRIPTHQNIHQSLFSVEPGVSITMKIWSGINPRTR